ncbi:triose-phosphate isomerase [Aquabacter sp. CN5-332]|uniref:triose-phosphate isomerase n=1 Tax=Aquabacter sp. CN5-332 TaxID=3156608 RepID=UPI0032B57951
MPVARRPLVAGNWKMNGLRHSGAELLAMIEGCGAPLAEKVDLLICPPATLLAQFAAEAAGSPIAVGGQDCHKKASGAHTGDVSAEMLADAGARFVIVGHSERRSDHQESDETVRAKAQAAWRTGLTAIVCVGETQAQREAGEALAVVAAQVRGSVPDGASADTLVVAYEPVWAIGSGLVPTVEDVEEMHGEIRRVLSERAGAEAARVRILYGGSVKPENCTALLNAADVDGALVGGASLKAGDFLAIARAYL